MESTLTASPPTIPLFTRIRDADGFVGTVVYVGSVASSKNPNEQYAGIVWDDHSRGKHDGSVICRTTNQIVRHFSCGPTQGSFLRPRKIDFGVVLTPAVMRKKYVEMNAPMIAPNNVLLHTMKTSSGREKSIEFFGELNIRKHQQLENMTHISLRREGICRASDDDDVMAEFQNIQEIDLAGNLLWNWEEVFKIMKQFPRLQNCSLAHNFVRDISQIPQTIDAGYHFDKLKKLNMNNCAVKSFQTVHLIGKTMPNLESLCIANSTISDVENYDDELQTLQNLRELDCSNCGLHQWENQVSKFSVLPHLESLSLDENPIRTIPIDAGSSQSFPNLLNLQLTRTAMETWIDLEGINSFPSLKSLRFKNLPLTTNLGEGEVRSMSIARFPNLDYLNSSHISREERIDAERRYVTLVTHSLHRLNPEPSSTKDDSDDEDSPERIAIFKKHPRYPELLEKHKNLTTFLKNEMKSDGTLSNSIFNITIRSMAPSSCTLEPIVRRLPGTMNVERMKALCSRTFDIDFDLINLRFRATNKGSFPVEMDDDSKTLDYYGLSDGAEIIVDEIDLEAKALDSKKNDEDLEKRMAELDRKIQAMQNVQIRR